jgi:hypothetical protein
MTYQDNDRPQRSIDPETRARQAKAVRTGRRIDSWVTLLGGVALATLGVVLTFSTDELTPATSVVMIVGGLAAITFAALELRKDGSGG